MEFIERARSELVRALGVDKAALKGEPGLVLAVRRVEADYLSPARFDDLLSVTTTVQAATHARPAPASAARRRSAV